MWRALSTTARSAFTCCPLAAPFQGVRSRLPNAPRPQPLPEMPASRLPCGLRGRLIVHGGVDARDEDLSAIVADVGADRLIPAIGQSSDLEEGPELVADLATSGLVGCDEAGRGLVDSATCRALTPEGLPRDDLL